MSNTFGESASGYDVFLGPCPKGAKDLPPQVMKDLIALGLEDMREENLSKEEMRDEFRYLALSCTMNPPRMENPDDDAKYQKLKLSVPDSAIVPLDIYKALVRIVARIAAKEDYSHSEMQEFLEELALRFTMSACSDVASCAPNVGTVSKPQTLGEFKCDCCKIFNSFLNPNIDKEDIQKVLKSPARAALSKDEIKSLQSYSAEPTDLTRGALTSPIGAEKSLTAAQAKNLMVEALVAFDYAKKYVQIKIIDHPATTKEEPLLCLATKEMRINIVRLEGSIIQKRAFNQSGLLKGRPSLRFHFVCD